MGYLFWYSIARSAFEQTDLLFLAIGASDMVAAGESKGLRLCHAIEQEMVASA